MSQSAPAPQQTVVIQQAPGTSGLAIAGLIFSLIGWLTCGLLCIPGAFLSFFGLFSRGPKGVAIAGLIVGFPGVLFFAFVGLGMIMAVLGIGAAGSAAVGAAASAAAEAEAQSQAELASLESTAELPHEIDVDDPLQSEPASDPTDDALSSLRIEEPAEDLLETPAVEPVTPSEEPDATDTTDVDDAPDWRTWTTADGKHTVVAKFLKFAVGTVTLEKMDGTTRDVKLDILSAEDQEYVKRRGWARSTE